MFKENDKVKILADTRQEKVEEFRERFANPYVAAERGHVDAVIEPSETRLHLIRALEMLDTKREKIPPNTATSRCRSSGWWLGCLAKSACDCKLLLL